MQRYPLRFYHRVVLHPTYRRQHTTQHERIRAPISSVPRLPLRELACQEMNRVAFRWILYYVTRTATMNSCMTKHTHARRGQASPPPASTHLSQARNRRSGRRRRRSRRPLPDVAAAPVLIIIAVVVVVIVVAVVFIVAVAVFGVTLLRRRALVSVRSVSVVSLKYGVRSQQRGAREVTSEGKGAELSMLWGTKRAGCSIRGRCSARRHNTGSQGEKATQ